MSNFKPMLAVAVEDVSKIKYPVLASPKLDGIRCVILDGKALSRSLKPIPNAYIRNYLERLNINGMDGEIMIPGKNFNEIQSAVMSEEGEPNFEYHVFDLVSPKLDIFEDHPFAYRYGFMSSEVKYTQSARVKSVKHKQINNVEELLAFESECVSSGYEGVMIRDPKGPYKFGRSTLKEGYLLKLKRFHDSEARIIGFTERMHNGNEAFTDELGHTKRSSHKANKTGTNMLGAFKVVNYNGEFEVGTGFTEAQRIEYWLKQKELDGKDIKFKYQELSKDGIPRFPVFLGFRSPIDTSE